MNLARRDFLKATLGGSATLAGLTACGPKKEARPPNLIVLMASGWRGRDLGLFGSSPVETPNLDRLAKQGVLFENAMTNAAVAGASRATFLTGHYPLQHGVVGNLIPLDPKNGSLGQTLTSRGWRSSFIGTWRLAGFPEQNYARTGPGRQGFDEYWAQILSPFKHFQSVIASDGAPPRVVERYMPTEQVDLAIDRLDRHALSGTNDPFFFFLSFGAPHPPFDQVPTAFKEKYASVDLELPPNWEASDEEPGGDEVGTLEKRRDYYAACTALDHEIGRLVTALDERRLTEDTLIVFLSDHGMLLGEHGLFHAQQPFDESIRIPLIARWPGTIPAGKRSDVLISMVDLNPSILSLMGAPVSTTIKGRDLSNAFRGELGADPEWIYLQEILGIGPLNLYDTFSWRGIRTKTHLYAEDLAGAWLLYDMERDPYQRSNLVGRRKVQTIERRLARDLRRQYADLFEDYLTPLEHLESIGQLQRMRQILAEQLGGQVRAKQARVLRTYLMEGSSWTNPRY